MNDIFEKMKKDFDEFMAQAQKFVEETKVGNLNTGGYNTGNLNTGDYNTGNLNTGDYNTGHANTGSHNTGNCNTGGWNTGHGNTGGWNTGTCNAGRCNTGLSNTGNFNTGNFNTGNCNTGNYNTGYCNTITPTDILVFNQPCKRSDWENAKKPLWMNVNLTFWVRKEDMTSAEKKAHPTYKTTGGYVKVYKSLHEAYKDSWDKASKEDKELTFKLPNFDIEVFKEIFGFTPEI